MCTWIKPTSHEEEPQVERGPDRGQGRASATELPQEPVPQRGANPEPLREAINSEHLTINREGSEHGRVHMYKFKQLSLVEEW